ncbi:MAG: transcriptional repressor [Clostridia bacterium]|nr:transcriptional repressor [Clostridia bacterium]
MEEQFEAQRRMTRQKKLVLAVAQAHCDHPTADQIYLEVRNIDKRISRGTVYRNLEQLSETGKLLHVKVPGAGRFDSRLDYHYHMVCQKCGAVCDVPIEYRHELDGLLFEKSGFKVERHRTIFEGLCSNCTET